MWSNNIKAQSRKSSGSIGRSLMFGRLSGNPGFAEWMLVRRTVNDDTPPVAQLMHNTCYSLSLSFSVLSLTLPLSSCFFFSSTYDLLICSDPISSYILLTMSYVICAFVSICSRVSLQILFALFHFNLSQLFMRPDWSDTIVSAVNARHVLRSIDYYSKSFAVITYKCKHQCK